MLPLITARLPMKAVPAQVRSRSVAVDPMPAAHLTVPVISTSSPG
jgi:hypothetical protein